METELLDSDLSYIILNQISEVDLLTVIIQMTIIICLMGLSGLISGSEVAFFSLTNTQKKTIKTSGPESLVNMIRLLQKPEKLLATILILNNLVNVAVITLSAYFTWNIFGKSNLVFLTLTIVVTLVIVFFGEIIPKVYANKNKMFFVKGSHRVISFSYFIFKPLVYILLGISNALKPQEKIYLESTKEELNKAMSLTIEKSASVEEKNILEGIINFGTIKTKEIMKSRVDVVAFEKEESFEEIAKKIIKYGYSRIPVYKETIDNIEGVLYVKDLIPHLKEGVYNWNKKVRPAFFVPENKNIDILFKDFQEKRVHLAMVIDEYGGVSGLITLEDIIEEIVGDIKDEFDFEETFQYKKIDKNTFLFEGKTSLNDFCKAIGERKDYFNLVKGDSESLGGLLLEVNSKIPSKGDKIKFDNYIFTIMSVDNKRIRRVKIYRKSKK